MVYVLWEDTAYVEGDIKGARVGQKEWKDSRQKTFDEGKIEQKGKREISRDCEREGEKKYSEDLRMGPLHHLSTTLYIQ